MATLTQFFAPEKISQNIRVTPEGYLLCCNVPIARAGDLLYKDTETNVEGGDEGLVVLSRSIEELSKEDSLSSCNGKPVVIGHPMDDEGNPVFLNPDNWGQFAVGTTQNVRVGKGINANKIIADFLITDRSAIDLIVSKELREISAGYKCETKQLSKGYGIQTRFRFDHSALVPRGRSGSECAIFDHEKILTKRGGKMNLKQKLSKILRKTIDSLPELEEIEEGERTDVMLMLAKINLRLEKLENMEKEEQEEAYEVTDRRHRDRRMRDRRHRDEDFDGGVRRDERDDLEDRTTRDDILELMENEIIAEDLEEKEDYQVTDRRHRDRRMRDRRHRDEEPGNDVSERLETIEDAIVHLLKKMSGETVDNTTCDEDEEEDVTIITDAATISKAEILAPGIRATKDIKRKALQQAYKDIEGRKAINSVLGGKTFDSADTDLLFNAAAEVLKSQRRDQVNATRFSANTATATGIMTPAALNEINAKRWGSK